jgi:peptide/nickel transport system substrate-binding protein
MIAVELPTLATKPLQETSATARAAGARETLNAELIYLDERALPQPYLAEALPELGTDTWRVLPDGKMETIYRLRSNLTWHDGQPLTAEDFVFSHRVHATPELGGAEALGFRSIESVAAPDPRTVLIRWKESFVDAGQVGGAVLPAMPRHILEQPYEERTGTSFLGLPFWTSQYVGAGPWKLDRHEPGAFFEGVAFDGFVFGRPKIDRVRVIYQPDSNVAVANLLAGEAHFSSTVLHGEEGITLERGWADNKAGVVLWETDIGKGQDIQQRPEYAVPTQLASDHRVRQALMFALDRKELTEVVTAGRGVFREIFTHAGVDYYDTMLRLVPQRYPHDPRRAQQLLEDAGFRRGADGAWLTPTGEPFTLEQWYLTGATNEKDSVIIVDTFRRFGIDATSNLWGISRSSQEERTRQAGLFGGNMELTAAKYHSRSIARAENRFTGANRYGFSHPDLDRFSDAFATALDRSERTQHLAAMERVVMEYLPGIPTYWTAVITAHASTLKGPVKSMVPDAGGTPRMWTWEWQS